MMSLLFISLHNAYPERALSELLSYLIGANTTAGAVFDARESCRAFLLAGDYAPAETLFHQYSLSATFTTLPDGGVQAMLSPAMKSTD